MSQRTKSRKIESSLPQTHRAPVIQSSQQLSSTTSQSWKNGNIDALIICHFLATPALSKEDLDLNLKKILSKLDCSNANTLIT